MIFPHVESLYDHGVLQSPPPKEKKERAERRFEIGFFNKKIFFLKNLEVCCCVFLFSGRCFDVPIFIIIITYHHYPHHPTIIS